MNLSKKIFVITSLLFYISSNNDLLSFNITLNSTIGPNSQADYDLNKQYSSIKISSNSLNSSDQGVTTRTFISNQDGIFISSQACTYDCTTPSKIFIAQISTLLLATIITTSFLYHKGYFSKLQNYFYPSDDETKN